jgi:hypothetical protein
MKIDKVVATGIKKTKFNQSNNVPYPRNFCILTSYINHTLSLKVWDMQKNYKTCSEASHCGVVMRPTCSATNKIVFLQQS